MAANEDDSRIPLFQWLMLISVLALVSIQPCMSITDLQNGDWSQKYETLKNTAEANLMVRTGDIDNLNFGWQSESRGVIDPFSGEITDNVSNIYWGDAWPTDPSDPAGTDRIKVVSSFDYREPIPAGGSDGYTYNTRRPANSVEPIILNSTDSTFSTISSGVLQMFINDFQAPSWGTRYQVWLSDLDSGNKKEIPEIEEQLNSIDQTGAWGILVTFQISNDYLYLLKSGNLSIKIDDPVTGAGDGYAIDFVKLLINFHDSDYNGTITGTVTDNSTNLPLARVTVSADGNLWTTTTDDNGYYTLTDVPAGLAVVKAQMPVVDGQEKEYESQIKTVQVIADANTPSVLNFSLVKFPVIITPPSSVVGCEGGSAVFRVTAYGTEPITYQWMKEGLDISDGDGSKYTGADGPKLTILDLSPSDEGNYTVSVSDSLGGSVISPTSYPFATLKVNSPPQIDTQPSSVTCTEGESASFTISASDAESLSYQWLKDGSYIPYANGDTYTIPSVSSSDAGTYTVEVSDSHCRVTSDKVTLTVNGAPSSNYNSIESFETLLKNQQDLLTSFDDLMGQTPVTREQKIEFLNSIEDLYRREAIGMDKFSIWINENWAGLSADERATVASSLEDLLRRQSGNLETYNGNLLAWCETFDQPYRQKFSDSFEDLMHRQVALLRNFEGVLKEDGMQTPDFFASCVDLLSRQARSLEGFWDLGEYTFNDTMPHQGPGIEIYETADKISMACGDNVTYKYTVYNNGDENLTNIEVTDRNLSHGLFTKPSPTLGVYQSFSIENTVTYLSSPGETYPIEICDNATASAKGTASGENVTATSNDVCVILNGPPEKASCQENGQKETVNGTISANGGCIILTAKDIYNLKTDDVNSEAWQNVSSVLNTGECATVTGCVSSGVGRISSCPATVLLVESCVPGCEVIRAPSVSTESPNVFASAKDQPDIGANEKNASLAENRSVPEAHPSGCTVCGKTHSSG